MSKASLPKFKAGDMVRFKQELIEAVLTFEDCSHETIDNEFLVKTPGFNNRMKRTVLKQGSKPFRIARYTGMWYKISLDTCYDWADRWLEADLKTYTYNGLEYC